MRSYKKNIITLMTIVIITACGETVERADKTIKDRQADLIQNNTIIPTEYFNKGVMQITAFHQQTVTFNQQLNQFISSPTDEAMETLQKNWLDLHQSWHKLDFYTYSAHYLSNQLPLLKNTLNHVHSENIAEQLIDSSKRNTGIIKNLEYSITPESLIEIHSSQKNNSAIIGLHAIEWMLWNNTPSDFIKKQTLSKAEQYRGLTLNDLPNARRTAYLKSLGTLQAELTKELVQVWRTTETQIKQLPDDQKKQFILGISRKISENILHNIDDNHSRYSDQLQWMLTSINNIDENMLEQHKNPLIELKSQMNSMLNAPYSMSNNHHLKTALDDYIFKTHTHHHH